MSSESDEGGDHPGELELRHYARGSLQRDHAAAILAHAVACSRCAARVRSLLPGDDDRRLLLSRSTRLPAGV